MCGISESLIFEEIIFQSRTRLVCSFTGVKAQTSLAGRDFETKSLLISLGRLITDVFGKDFKGFLGG